MSERNGDGDGGHNPTAPVEIQVDDTEETAEQLEIHDPCRWRLGTLNRAPEPDQRSPHVRGGGDAVRASLLRRLRRLINRTSETGFIE